MKILFITESLVLFGGTEKILTEKANYLAEHFGFEVTVITCTQPNHLKNAFPLFKTIKQINLCISYYRRYKYGYPKRFWLKREIDRELQNALAKAIAQLTPDIIIGTAGFRADIICTIDCKAKKIIECHEARYFIKADLDRQRSIITRLFVDLYQRKKYLQTIEEKADVVVTLTEGDKALWNRARRVEVIPNFSTMRIKKYSNCKNKRIIAVGRLSPEKGYERLIEVWKLVSPQYPDWILDIFGDGKMHEKLNTIIQNSGLRNIYIHQATPHISENYAKSSICVMTSYLEGFGLAILESLKHGIPCIAFDCPFGPRSIIKDGICGYLVEDGNVQQFADKLGFLMGNEETRIKFSAAAIERAKDFSVESVMCRWKQLFVKLLKE